MTDSSLTITSSALTDAMQLPSAVYMLYVFMYCICGNSSTNVQVHPRRAADGIQTGGLSASDETPCSDSSFSCAEFWDEESPGGFGMESAIFWVRRKAKLQEVAMKWLESKIAEVPDPQLQSAIAALINP
jgi:hypothetical protein